MIYFYMTGQDRHDWASMLENNHTAGTTRDYESWASRFEDWKEWADVSVSLELLYTFDEFLNDPETMRRFADEYVDGHSVWNRCRIPDEGYSYRTRVKALSAVKSYVDFVYDVEFPNQQKYKINNVVDGDPPAFDPPTASPDEVEEIFEDTESCSFGSCHPMTRLGYDAIMRCAEITRVEWDDVNIEKGRIYVRSAKGSPERWVTLSPKTVDVLIDHRQAVLEHFDNPKWLFYRLGGFKWNKTWTAQKWGEHFRNAHGMGFHDFARHSPITNRLNNGESLTDVSRRARHANFENTIKYDQLADNGSIPPELQ